MLWKPSKIISYYNSYMSVSAGFNNEGLLISAVRTDSRDRNLFLRNSSKLGILVYPFNG